MKKNNILNLTLCLSAFLFCSCSSDSGTSSNSTSSSFDSSISGTWVQVSALTALDEDNSILLSSDSIDINEIGNLPLYANDGHIWEDFGGSKLYRYTYSLIGDTLWMLGNSFTEEDTPLDFDKTWATAYVKAENATNTPNIDPALIATWMLKNSTNRSYTITPDQIIYRYTYDQDYDSTTYGDDEQVYMHQGLFYTIAGSDTTFTATYKVLDDTLMFSYCNTLFCTAIKSSNSTLDKYIRQ